MKPRAFRVSRGSADRDPMFMAVWYDGAEMTLTPTPQPMALVLPPLPPPDPKAEQWEAVLDAAAEVNAALRGADTAVLMSVVFDLVHSGAKPVAADIIAAYHRRMQELRHG